MPIRDGDRVYVRGNREREGIAIALIFMPMSDEIYIRIRWDDNVSTDEHAPDVVKIKKRRTYGTKPTTT